MPGRPEQNRPVVPKRRPGEVASRPSTRQASAQIQPTPPSGPYEGFGGVVGRTFSTSTPWWPTEPAALSGAPNVVILLVDDLGYADLGCYGSEIATPNIDLLAHKGVRFTNFHVNPMCSPTRASLLTGLNAHLAGFGFVAHSDPGFPGYAMELRPDVTTLAQLFRDSGWATFALGKWHLCKDSHLHDGAPKHSWPLQAGFDRYYGILEGFTNLHQPHRLYRDNHVVEVDDYPSGYYLSDDLTDQAIDMITRLRSSHPTRPFFMYFGHAAVHAPLHAKPDDMGRYRGRYDCGWDEIRRQRFERQKALGVVEQHAVLPPRNHEPEHEVKAWQDLNPDEQRLFSRYKETYAAMVDNIDQNLGRLRVHLESLGEWANTIVVFTSDNGASREGQRAGTASYFRTLLGAARNKSEDLAPEDLERIELIGGPQTMPHYPMGWAMASNTPFRLFKANTHQGGHQVPFIVSWPNGNLECGALRDQYQHVTDLFPTLAALAGASLDRRSGPPLSGTDFVPTLTCDAQSSHLEQYYESWGHRGFYRQGWSASTCHLQHTAFSEESWELHDLKSDPTETTDLAELHPDKLAELVQGWEEAAWANQVFPLDERSMLKETTRPPSEVPLSLGVVLRPGTPTLERYRSLKLIQYRSFSVICSLSFARGDQGMLFAHGDQGGGYAMRIEDDRLWLEYNGYGPMTNIDCGTVDAGEREIRLELTALEGSRADVLIKVNGETVGQAGDLPLLMAMAPFQGIDVGIDRRSPVCWDRYQRHGPFPYRGSLHSVRWEPGAPSPEDPTKFADLLREMYAKYD